MKGMALALTAVMIVGLTALHADDKKDDTKAKLVGTWEPTSGDAPKGSTLVFTKEGKLSINIEAEGKKLSIEGTFEVDGQSLKTTLKGPDGKERKETMKIKSLTDKELVTVDEKGKEDTFKKQEKK